MANSEKDVPLHRERISTVDKEAFQKAQEARRRQLREDMAQTFATEEGRRVLFYIMELCGFLKPPVGGNPQLGMDVMQGTLYNAARQTIYLELRKIIPAHILRKVEFGDLLEIS